MNEISIQLAEVNPTVFYGGNKSKNIAILKRYFPKLKIVARGDIVTAYGEEEVLEEFEKQMDRLMMHYGKYNSLDESTVEKILTSSSSTPRTNLPRNSPGISLFVCLMSTVICSPLLKVPKGS